MIFSPPCSHPAARWADELVFRGTASGSRPAALGGASTRAPIAPQQPAVLLAFRHDLGFSECWFKDEQQFLRVVDTPTWATAVADGDNLFDMTQMLGAVLHETVVKAGDRELATA